MHFEEEVVLINTSTINSATAGRNRLPDVRTVHNFKILFSSERDMSGDSNSLMLGVTLGQDKSLPGISTMYHFNLICPYAMPLDSNALLSHVTRYANCDG